MLCSARISGVRTVRHQLRCNQYCQGFNALRFRSTAISKDEPLRILFCGSDEFSIVSLEALQCYAAAPGSNVQTIDVATKTDKRVGRGLKTIRAPPIKAAAQNLGLPLHQFDTFRGWQLPPNSSINMVIAVSFGLFVPPRILSSCRFGGLNVHPSMLPDLKGSAPIEHAIINGYRKTGVTIQTLHPSKFDEGQIVAQTPAPGLDIPDPDTITATELRDMLARIGADMLVQSLKHRLYLQPRPPQTFADEQLVFAPKLLTQSRHVDFRKMPAEHIIRLNRAVGRLWVSLSQYGMNADARLLLGSYIRIATAAELKGIPYSFLAELQVALPFCVIKTNKPIEHAEVPMLVKVSDGKLLCIPEMAVSGMRMGSSSVLAHKARLFDQIQDFGACKVHTFKKSPA